MPIGAGHERREAVLPPRYQPAEVEKRWYQYWLDNNVFRAEVDPDREPFSIVIPPPNVTGSLHMGHALDNTLQDILVRRRRMQGYAVLWMPGTDHAGIATQYVVERRLAEDGITRQQLGREAFVARVWDWKEEYEAAILGQLQRLGASCDWSRTRFTMDEGCSRAVREAFVHLFERGLIYRGEYMVNWCPRCQTTLADLEVEHRQREGRLYQIRYPIADSNDFIQVATTRPETMLGDTAVAVHPDDDRYRHLIGRKVLLPLVNREIPIIADEWVDREFGTGAVKVTPGHDPNDFELGRRHQLPIIKVIGLDGTMTEAAGEFQGLDRYECREKVIATLEQQGLLAGSSSHVHSVGHCYRCQTVVEPMVSRQWFVRMKPLAEPAIKAVREGKTRIIPKRFEKIYFHWLENIRDWPVSRQIWWGHRIPAWYCPNDHMVVAKETPEQCPQCGSETLEQDPDVLDTWFSSALWPFSTMGWPDDTPELRYFYPTTVLVTGYDILFFWVARMMFMGLEFMHDVPFRTVLLHGLVRDAEGQKMSKSRGNVIDPLEVIDEFGADALRWSLITGNTPGNDMRLNREKLEAGRNFCNKLWNAARFVLMHLRDDSGPAVAAGATDVAQALRPEDRWILHRLNATIRASDNLLERFEIGEAAQALYEFIWSEYCDWYIELVKPRLGDGGLDGAAARHTLATVLEVILRLLHPYMPFITEELWQHLPGKFREGSTIALASWPGTRAEWVFEDDARNVTALMEIIRAIRSIRADFKIDPARKIDVILHVYRPDQLQFIEGASRSLTRLAGVKDLKLVTALAERPRGAAVAVASGVDIYVPLAGVIDIAAELARLEKEYTETDAHARRMGARLNDPNFLAKAPADVIEQQRRRHRELQDRLQRLAQRIEHLRHA